MNLEGIRYRTLGTVNSQDDPGFSFMLDVEVAVHAAAGRAKRVNVVVSFGSGSDGGGGDCGGYGGGRASGRPKGVRALRACTSSVR